MADGSLVLQAIKDTLDADPRRRQAAEAQLSLQEGLPAFGVCLMQIALAGEAVPVEVRQAAALMLKHYIHAHWQEGERGFRPPEVVEADKVALRAGLPAGLADPSSKMRTAVGMAIAEAAAWDWPNAWPGLVEGLVAAVSSSQDASLVAGSLRCLAMMVTDLDEESKPQLCSALAPALANIVADPSPAVRPLVTPALHIMVHLVAGLGALSGAHQRATRDQMAPLLPTWSQLLARVLSQPVQAPVAWLQLVGALRLLLQFVTYFSKHMEPVMPALMGHCWRLLTSGLPVYEAEVVGEGGDEDGTAPDSAAAGGPEADLFGVADETEEPSLEALVSQLFEVLLAVVGRPRFAPLMRPALAELAYLALGYAQMTHDQVEVWGSNPNQFVADEEEDMISPRASAELLLGELHEAFAGEAVRALLSASQRRLGEAAAAKAAGQPGWWKMREAVLQVLGGFADSFEEACEEGSMPGLRQQLTALLQDVLQHDLMGQAATAPPGEEGGGREFLVGRALWMAAKLAPLADAPVVEAFLRAAAEGVSAPLPAPVKIGACRAVAALAPRAAPELLTPLLPGLVGGLSGLLGTASEETLHLVLETLAAVVRASPQDAAPHAMALAPAVLQVWATCANDPLVSTDALEVLEALASCPACLPSLAQSTVPTLAGIVARPQGQAPLLLEASLELLALLVRAARGCDQREVLAALVRAALLPALRLVQGGAEDGVPQATQLIIELVRGGGEETLTWAAEASGAQVAQALLDASQKLLSPQLNDASSALAGPLVVQLMRSLPRNTNPHLPGLVQAAAQKLVVSSAPPVVGGLLLLFSRLVLADAPALLALLEQATVTLPDGSVSLALPAVLPLWLDRVQDVSGEQPAKVGALALVRLLDLRQRPSLAGLTVQGEPVASGNGVRTRSQASRQGGLVYSRVQAPVKILGCLMDMLQSAREASDEAVAMGRELGGWGNASDSEDDSGAGAAEGWQAAEAGEGRSSMQAHRVDLLDLLQQEAEAEEVPGGEDPAERQEPWYGVPLEDLIGSQVARLAAADGAFVASCLEGLGAGQRAMLQRVLAASPT